MQPVQTLHVLSENTKQIFQICVDKQFSDLEGISQTKRILWQGRTKLLLQEIM